MTDQPTTETDLVRFMRWQHQVLAGEVELRPSVGAFAALGLPHRLRGRGRGQHGDDDLGPHAADAGGEGPGMKLLALDPSSTLTGYAVFEDGRLLHAGWLKPRRVRDAPIDRITAMADDLADQLRETLPHRVVIEIPSGHVGRKRHKGAGAGLAIYGMAVGAMWAVCDRHVPPVEVAPVTEEQWTRGTPKPARQRAVAARYADYAEIMAADKGGDVADAIALGEWYLTEQRLQEAST